MLYMGTIFLNQIWKQDMVKQIYTIPKDKTKAGYILELKRAYTKKPEKEVEKALQQIDENNSV